MDLDIDLDLDLQIDLITFIKLHIFNCVSFP